MRRLLDAFRRRKEIASLLTILPGVTNGDGSKNICLVQLSSDKDRLLVISGDYLYSFGSTEITAAVDRVREVIIEARYPLPIGTKCTQI